MNKRILVVVVVLAAGCWSGRGGPRGTNLGQANEEGKPGTSQGGVPALVERP